MREIKFRAWDKLKKAWYESSSEDNLGWYGFHLFGECMMEFPPIGYIKNLEVTQFTGLKDKNGIEIYESDVLDGEWEYGKYEVDFFHFIYYTYTHPNCLEDIQVIGNIYENPELVK